MTEKEKQEYLIFKMKEDRVESLIHSYNYHANIASTAGYPITGALKNFMDQLGKVYSNVKRRKINETKTSHKM